MVLALVARGMFFLEVKRLALRAGQRPGGGGGPSAADVQPPIDSIVGKPRTKNERRRRRTESMGRRSERAPSASRGQGMTVRTGSSWISSARPMLDPEPFLSQYVQLDPSRVNRYTYRYEPAVMGAVNVAMYSSSLPD